MYVAGIITAFIIGVVITAIVIFAVIKITYKLRQQKARYKSPKVKKKVEFSKLVLALVLITYFVGVGVGVRLSFIDYTQYSTLAMLVGTPTAAAIGFYIWKAKAENIIKIKKENPEETQGVPIDLNNINQ